ncbi:MAG TPA: hemerythrin domain-containing protein [Usitatibacter sp.]|nr:hemerythrin domain-containing protein [Usitatibacter sp.]
MRIHDLPPGFDDPVDALLGFHRRIERQLAALCGLPGNIESRGMDAEVSAAAGTAIGFFSNLLNVHHADEEDLMPLLEMRLVAEERDAVRSLGSRLQSEHREMDRVWRALRRPLDSLAEGINRGLPRDLLQYYRALLATHISIEEGGIHLRAVRCLTPADRAALGRGMVARRTRKLRFA